jgi:hypothetical protein
LETKEERREKRRKQTDSYKIQRPWLIGTMRKSRIGFLLPMDFWPKSRRIQLDWILLDMDITKT